VTAPAPDSDLDARLGTLRESIAATARAAGRDPGEITLVGISKRQPARRLVAAVRAGVRELGESFAQEARDKLPEVLAELARAGLPTPRLHFVGRLQTNKARLVAPLFDVVHSIDRAALATELGRRARSVEKTLDGLLQVNVSHEPQKAGVSPNDAAELLDHCGGVSGLRIVGLMGMAAAAAPAERRRAFAHLRELRDTLVVGSGHALPELSMGMTDDYELAIAEGATIVRIGTALFGPRDPQDPQ
jgi:pyridoxal phosphate enzyme (YggS family)